MEDCVFCKIVKGDIPSKKVYEDKNVLAFHDINPASPVHVLIIPKKHVESLASSKPSDSKVLGEIQLAAKKVAKKMGIEKAFRLATVSGYDAGQRVFHLHYHLTGGWGKKKGEMREGVKQGP